MSVDARRTIASDWSYVSEGGATIVFSYAGPTDSELDGMVLRLRKAPIRDLESTSPPSSPDIEEEEYLAETDDPTVLFQSRVTSHLVPPAHLPRLVSCRVSYALLSDLSTPSASIRPAERTSKDTIDTRKRRAVLATDLIGHSGSSFAIEIKPKWAFLPSPTYLSPETRDVKLKNGRFVMHSYYRTWHADNEEPVETSTYDPLELFAEEEQRIHGAVCALWDSWVASGGAANNLKIFMGGRMVKPSTFASDEGRSMKPLSDALHVPPMTPQSHELSQLRNAFTSHTTEILTESPILPLLRHLQSSLDPLDIEGLDAHWKRFHSSSIPVPPLGKGEPEPDLNEWESFVSSYISNGRQLSAPPSPSPSDSTPMSAEQLREYILAYLMSATFKDCSIIIDMADVGMSRSKTAEERVKVIDLDPKSAARLDKWRKLDREIALAYASRSVQSSGE